MSFVRKFPVRSRRRRQAALVAIAATAVLAAGGARPAGAHTEADYVAVPAGDEVTVHFAPTHGCSGSPTTGVSVRVPVAGAVAGDVEGFSSSVEADGDRTVLRWTGGLIPADEAGQFPITFTVPDEVGALLLFPTVQTCEVGEIAWIDGDPEGDHPAARMLVLAAGSEAARSIDDVPLDAPGRDQLTAVVDVDNPAGTTVPDTTQPPATEAPATTAPTATEAPATTEGAATTTPVTTAATPTTAAESTTVAPGTTIDAADTTSAPSTTEADDDDGSGAATAVFIGVIAVVVLGAVAGVLIARRNRTG